MAGAAHLVHPQGRRDQNQLPVPRSDNVHTAARYAILNLTPMIFSREYIGYLGRRTVKHLIDAKLITTSNLKATEERVIGGLTEELSLEDRINEEVRVILEAYSEEMRKTGAQYAEMFKKVKGELTRKYKAVL
jgi:hypothetical protein